MSITKAPVGYAVTNVMLAIGAKLFDSAKSRTDDHVDKDIQPDVRIFVTTDIGTYKNCIVAVKADDDGSNYGGCNEVKESHFPRINWHDVYISRQVRCAVQRIAKRWPAQGG